MEVLQAHGDRGLKRYVGMEGPSKEEVGKPFNPCKKFRSVVILPESLCRLPDILPGAKLTYALLLQYAGEDGRCYPSVKNLAKSIVVRTRQTQKYLAHLEVKGLIRRAPRRTPQGQAPNGFEFLWHRIFEDEGVNSSSRGG